MHFVRKGRNMRIGIDIDNVISNFDEVLLKNYLEHDKTLNNSGIVHNDKYIRQMFDWDSSYENDYYKKNIEKIAKSLEPLDDAVYYINKLKNEGFSIYLVSGRNNGEYLEPKTMTEEWLKKYNILYDKLILTDAYNHVEKSDVCLKYNIDLMIDDSIKVCKECFNKNINCILFNTPYNKKEDRFTRLTNWKEIYNYIMNN